MKINHRLIKAVGFSIGLVLWLPSLWAQAIPVPLELLDLEQLGNIRVSVTRQIEKVDAVSAHVQVVTASQNRDKGDRSLFEIGRTMPSLELSRLVNIPFVFSRGIGSDIPSVGVDSSTALHLDGVYLGLPDMTLPLFWDLDRVEILSGPQGSLYGRNAVAGVINIINRQPELNVNRREISAQFGSNGLRSGEVVVNQPINDTHALRLSLLARSDDGYTRNLDPSGSRQLDNHDARALRFQWLKGSLESAYILLSADYYQDDAGGTSARPLDTFGAAFALAVPTNEGETRDNLPSYTNVLSQGIRLVFMKQWTDWRASGNIAWRHMANRYLHNTDGTEIDITASDFLREIDQLTGDFVATKGQTEAHGRWTLGANLYQAQTEYDVGLIRAPLGSTILFKSPLKTKATSLFSEWERTLAERWKFTIGARYSYETKHQKMWRYTAPGLNGLASNTALLTPAVQTDFERNWAKLTPRAVLSYQLDDTQHLYASVTNGFKSGGMNSLSADAPVEPEDAWSFEAGHRYISATTGLSLATTVFHMQYRNLQVTSYANSSATLSNAATSSVTGLEMEIQKQFTKQFDVLCDVALLNARYGSYTAAQAGQPIVADGNQMPHAPRWRTNLTGRYNIALATGQLELRLNWNTRAKTYFNALEDKVISERSLNLWNASLLWRSQQKWWLQLSAKNLGNVRYYDNIVRFTSSSTPSYPAGNALGYPAPGRIIEVAAGFEF